MTRTILRGLNGASPLGFLGAVGLLLLLRRQSDAARLGFLSDGSFHPFVEGLEVDLPALVAKDAEMVKGKQPWALEYEKEEKRGTKRVADLKAPPEVFARFLSECVARWCKGAPEGVVYAAAFGTDFAVDGKGNTKPTAFHFTAANQQFLGTVETVRSSVTAEWAQRSLFAGNATCPGGNLRWDPASERNWALMANNPNDAGTQVDAPLEWLAFRGLALFPTFPRGSRIVTTAVSGRGEEMKFTWPLWSLPASLATVRSLLPLGVSGDVRDRFARGVFAVCISSIRRTSQGYGNFGPATVTS